MRAPRVALVAVALWGACSRDPESKAPLTTVTARSCKPEPPVAIAMTSRVVGPDRYEVTVTTTAKAALDRLDLELVLPPGVTGTKGKASFGAAVAGDRNVLVAIVETHARSVEVSAIARVPVEGIAMTKAATVTLGEARPQPKTKQYATADGERVREVRP